MARIRTFFLVFAAVYGGSLFVKLAISSPRGPASGSAAVISSPEAPAPSSAETCTPTCQMPVISSPGAVPADPDAKTPIVPAIPEMRGSPKQVIVNLCRSGRLFRKADYAVVRKAFSSLFADEHAAEIRSGLGADHDRIMAWLEQHADFKEDLFTALDEKRDHLVDAFAVLRSMWLWSPGQVAKNPDLAVATVVVWDFESAVKFGSNFHLRPNAVSTKPQVGGLGNFQYLVNHSGEPGTKTRFLPWEILTFVVDHLTPLAERDWARNYVRQNPHATWYLDPPYDFELCKVCTSLPSDQKQVKLNGREYSLSNIRTFGGVCTQRGDFAVRVGKSVGVPSLYCQSYPDPGRKIGHAWCAHMTVLNVWGDQVDIRVDYFGRHTVDGYFYNGQACDPQTCQWLNERDIERRWWVAGQDRIGKRQAVLAMRGYFWLKDELPLDTQARCAFLERCLNLNFYDESTWAELGRMARADEFPSSKVPPFLHEHIARLTGTAARFPDFVLDRFDSLLGAYPDLGDRMHFYSFALKLVEGQGRADLAERARARIAALQKARGQ